MKYLLSIIFAFLAMSAHGQTMPGFVVLSIDGTDSGFIINEKTGEITWIKGDCERVIPSATGSPRGKSDGSGGRIYQSARITDNTEIGRHRFLLEQAFKFDLDANPPVAEVYNSLRGGWTQIPVQIEESGCEMGSSCPLRMNLPPC